MDTSINIPDDTSTLAAVFAEMKTNFGLNITKSLEFREKALNSLINTY